MSNKKGYVKYVNSPIIRLSLNSYRRSIINQVDKDIKNIKDEFPLTIFPGL